MSIKPIDVQINIGQMHEIAKGEQTRTDGIVEKQHILDEESDEKSKLVQSRLEENKKAEHTVIMREEKQNRKNKKILRKKKEEKADITEDNKNKYLSDDKIGRIIDVRK